MPIKLDCANESSFAKMVQLFKNKTAPAGWIEMRLPSQNAVISDRYCSAARYPFRSLISNELWAVKHDGFQHCSGIVVAREVG